VDKKITIFVGTRPEIIKMASVIKEAFKKKSIDTLLVHTEQHYDWNMAQNFLGELRLPTPKYFLGVKSGSHGAQTARVMQRTEKLLKIEKPDIVLVEGDTNSALGVALASVKLKIPVGHVEAGCRCFDKTMPEEINRVVVADCATFHFTPTENCTNNLIREGIELELIYQVGHPLVDLLNEIKIDIDKSHIMSKLGLKEREYVLLTTHREENADDSTRLNNIIQAMSDINLPVIFPIHPRTQKNAKLFNVNLRKLVVIEPQPYFDTLKLIKDARVVFTDSGGIQQEACVLGTTCITLRERTEWTETIEKGVNFLAGANEKRILTVYDNIESKYENLQAIFKRTKGIFGKGDAARRIIDIVGYKTD
jgi:UDP-N-acetylglucosamine 2-epimerase (non-hydrolysing)